MSGVCSGRPRPAPPARAKLLPLLFSAGFSTNTTVSELSGRGIGLDAVRRAIAALGGQVSLSSTAGQGARCQLAGAREISREAVLVIQLGSSLWGLPSRAIDRVVELPTPERAGTTASISLADEHVPGPSSLARLLGVTEGPGAEADSGGDLLRARRTSLRVGEPAGGR